jgi:hypothetical protein
MKLNFLLFLVLVAAVSLASSGCGMVSSAVNNVTGFVVSSETAVVIANRAQIRSSYAVVAADLLEVKRGETLDILEETDFEKVHWYRVRARDEDATEGWIEAQNVITEPVLEKSKKLADEDKGLQSQATAQLRAASNLRLSPEQRADNILFKLDNGSTFEIIGWKYVPKVVDAPEVDDASKNGDKNPSGRKKQSKNDEVEAAKEDDDELGLDEKYDIWYRVRLDPSISPAPAGWVFGRQVELQVPSDISFFQNGATKFVTWHRLDEVDPNEKTITKDKDAAKVTKPGSWVILSRGNDILSEDGNEPDFDGIMVLAYDKYNEEHYPIYKKGDVYNNGSIEGFIPLKVEGVGDNKSFTVRLKNSAGQIEEKTFMLSKDPKGRLKITPPADMPK